MLIELVELAIGLIAIKIIVYGMANKRILFLTVREGEAVAVMVGGKLHKIIMNMRGFHLAPQDNGKIKKYDVVPEEDHHKGLIAFFFPGVYWLGLPGVANVYRYSFYWVKIDKDGAQKTMDQMVEQIYTKKYQYVMLLKDAETRSMVKVSFPVLVTIQVENPYTALFLNDKWLVIVTSAVLGRVKDFVAGFKDPSEIMALARKRTEPNSDETIGSEKKTSKKSYDLGKRLFNELNTRDEDGDDTKNEDDTKNNTVIEEIRKKQGVRIVGIDVTNVEIDPKWVALSIAEISAEKEGDAAVKTAAKGAEALGIRTTAEVDNYSRVINELGPDFYIALKRIEQLTAASKVGTNILVDIGNVKEFLLASALRSGVDPSDAQKTLELAAKKKGIKIPSDVVEQNETVVPDVVAPVKVDKTEITSEERELRTLKKFQ